VILFRTSSGSKPFYKKGTDVARVCTICGKGPQFGHNISHSHRVTKRRFNPNLQKMRILHEGKVRRTYVCTRCLRTGRVQKVFSATKD
jgi:large subunit ribosomal protein L28